MRGISSCHKSGVYLIRNTFNGKVYVGSSIDINVRGKAHVRLLRSGIHSNSHLQSAWKQCGPDAFEFSVIEECPVDVLIARETAWVGYYGSLAEDKGYNLEYPDRRGHTEETKRKISASRTGNPKCMGHKKSDKVRRKLSELHRGNKYNLGRKYSEETKSRMSQSHRGLLKGSVLSDEHKKKLSEAHKGKTASIETRRILSEKTRMYWQRKNGGKNL